VNAVTVAATARAARAGRAWPTFGRWMLGFIGFPLGGLLAVTTVGAVADPPTALVAGGLTGAVLGLAQSLAAPALPRRHWIGAGAVGLSAGLALGATAVDFDTTAGALAVQGAISGLVLGAVQAIVLVGTSLVTRRLAALWPLYLCGCWALGWTITTAAGVDVERQYTVFGATGAIVVTALTSVLPLVLLRSDRR
jgi:hypothetical protein